MLDSHPVQMRMAGTNPRITDPPPVLLFSKINKIFVGYFDPENIFLDNENK